jgi:FkbM family methyltransferase
MPFLIDYLRSEDIFVDVGANVGVYSLLAASVPQTTVIAYEPSSDSFYRLQENVALNQLERISPRRLAVGSEHCQVVLSVGSDTTNRVLTGELAKRSDAELVSMTTLDELMEDLGPAAVRIAVVKIDVEGGELDVIAGATRLLTQISPVLIVEENDPAALRSLLTSLGYAVIDYEPATRTVTRSEVTQVSKAYTRNLIAAVDATAVGGRLVGRAEGV